MTPFSYHDLKEGVGSKAAMIGATSHTATLASITIAVEVSQDIGISFLTHLIDHPYNINVKRFTLAFFQYFLPMLLNTFQRGQAALFPGRNIRVTFLQFVLHDLADDIRETPIFLTCNVAQRPVLLWFEQDLCPK
jgi:hypothetical protein